MLGEKGTQVSSKTTWKNGKTERIDVENPVPGERPDKLPPFRNLKARIPNKCNLKLVDILPNKGIIGYKEVIT